MIPRQFFLAFCFLSLVGCVSIPKETIVLSETLEKDIAVLQKSHLQMATIHFNDMEDKINIFVDDVYAPFIINHVLKDELQEYQAGNPSIYTSLMKAGESNDKEVTAKALQEMAEFVKDAQDQIEEKRKEMLLPVQQRKREVTQAITISYNNAINANTTLTAYLRSVQKVKDSQEQVLSMLGLENIDTKISDNLVRISDEISLLNDKAKKVDAESDEAYEKLNEISEKIKQTFNKNQ